MARADSLVLCVVAGLYYRWRNFLSPDIEHPRKSPFTEWEIAVVVLVREPACQVIKSSLSVAAVMNFGSQMATGK